MRAGTFLVLLYWAIFTVRAGFLPTVNKGVKAAAYDLKGNDPKLAEAARRKIVPLKAAGAVLCGLRWLEMLLLVVLVAWIFWIIGALISGTVVVFGYQI